MRSLLVTVTLLALSVPCWAARPTRGYTSRACGFDLDDDFVYGETEDCNVCDGQSGSGAVTVDYDGDTTDETEIYIDGTSGTDTGGCGGPSNPCETLSYALQNIGGGGEEAYCIKGTLDDNDFALTGTYDGASGYKTRTASGSEIRDFQYPDDPMMIIGWDTDDDGEYPPHDADDNGTINVETIVDEWLSLTASYVEIAHLDFTDNLTPGVSGDDSIIVLANKGSGNSYSHVYIHDLDIGGWLQDEGSDGITFGTWTNNSEGTWFAYENISCDPCGSNFHFRGSAANGTSEPGYTGSGPFRVQNFTLRGDSENSTKMTFVKMWGEWDGIEFIDNDLDLMDTAWTPGAGNNGIVIGQCIQDVVIRNNYIAGVAVGILPQASAAGACTTRDLCNATAGVGNGCIIDANEFIHDYDFNDDGFIRTGDEGQGPVIGDIYVTNNIVYHSIGAGPEYIFEEGAPDLTDSTVTIVGNTFTGDLGSDGVPGGIKAGSSNHLNWDVRNNVFDIGTTYKTILLTNAPGGWSADYNTYPASARWEWDGVTKTSLADWRSASSGDTDAEECVPTFEGASDFHLASNDTCATDEGTNVTAVTAVDYDNDARPTSNADIGMDEYTVGGAPADGVSLLGLTLQGVVVD